ncbi:hypothetical protein [Ottowia sp.]|uniref:hypothetical protein n=1 Tax=Ottowia sp. TaxID=1898956 RepID=UPI003A84A2ED
MHTTMHTCLITITCLGEQRRIVRAAASTCDAILWALCHFPQACRVGASVLGAAANQEGTA